MDKVIELIKNGKTISEISKLLDQPYDTVKYNVHNIKQKELLPSSFNDVLKVLSRTRGI